MLDPGIIMKNKKCIDEIDEELSQIKPIKANLAKFYNANVHKK